MFIVRKLRDYSQLIKLRLSLLVVFSAAASYYLASEEIELKVLFFLSLGGLFVTGSANCFNEIYERDLDKKMNRTRIRPIPDGRMGVTEAVITGALCGIAGFLLLLFFVNLPCALISGLSFLLYVFVYTPIKLHSPIAVYLGAFPGAMPVLIGCSAGSIENLTSLTAMHLIALQFLWQFPHFWSIAWVLDDDYKKAGFHLLPSENQKTSALQIFLYTISLLPVSLLPVLSGNAGMITAAASAIVSGFFIGSSYRLYRNCTLADARIVMYWSFAYLPVVLLARITDKLY